MIVSNYCGKNGGGLSNCGIVKGCKISYNAANIGGGANSCTLVNCTNAHNMAEGYGEAEYRGAGGGLAYGSATNCVFRDNAGSATYLTESLYNCDIADSRVSGKVVENCVLHGIGNEETCRAIGNVAYPDGVVVSNFFMVYSVRLMRNCLITNCTWKSIPGSFVNSAMFAAKDGMDLTSVVDNCTIADNDYYHLTRHFNTPTTTVAFVNTALVRNRNASQACDVRTTDSKYFVMSNCVYNVKGSFSAKAEGFEDYGCLELGAGADPKFATVDGVAPYTPKRSSPLRGKGMLLDWMTENATDYAGNPRVRDGKVDVGALQCWLNPVGSMLLLR